MSVDQVVDIGVASRAKGPTSPIEMPSMMKIMTTKPIVFQFHFILVFSRTTAIINYKINNNYQGAPLTQTLAKQFKRITREKFWVLS